MTEQLFEKLINKKLKISFALIKQDIGEIQSTVDKMRKYIIEKSKEYDKEKNKDKKIQKEFERDVNEFTQKISQLKLALEAVQNIKKEVVIKKDLAQIEERIRTSFRSEIDKYKEQIKKLRLYLREMEKKISYLESNKVFKKKKLFFLKREENQYNNF